MANCFLPAAAHASWPVCKWVTCLFALHFLSIRHRDNATHREWPIQKEHIAELCFNKQWTICYTGEGSLFVIIKKLFLYLWVIQCPRQPGVIQEFLPKRKRVPVGSLMLFSPCGESCPLTGYHTLDIQNTIFMPVHFPLRKRAAGRTTATSSVLWFSLARSTILICNVPEICSFTVIVWLKPAAIENYLDFILFFIHFIKSSLNRWVSWFNLVTGWLRDEEKSMFFT